MITVFSVDCRLVKRVLRTCHTPTALASASENAKSAILQFFAAEVSNPNTRRSYLRAAEDFFHYVSNLNGGDSLQTITSIHVASWIDHLGRVGLAVPTIKIRLAALRSLFDALAREQIIRINPAGVVRGPKHSVKRGKTPALTADEARQLLDAIDLSTLVGLRDRALIATMVYSFARIGAVTS